MFLPNILILFFGINLLEQTGYMARSAFLLDGIMKKFGLQGKAFIPLVSGFGCSVPAYMAARTLKNPKDRLITMLIIGFFSCSARLPVYVLLIGAFFPASMAGNVLFGIYVSGAILGMIMAKILRSVLFKGEAEPFVMEMPRYRLPSLKAVYLDLKIKTMMFIQKAGTFIAVASMVVWFLSSYPINEEKNLSYDIQIENAPTEQLRQDLYNKKLSVALEESYLGYVGKSIEPIFAPMGFDWRLSVATVSALAAKEIAVSTLATLYSVGSSEDHQESFLVKIRELIDFKTAMALIVIIMTYSPCLAAMGTFYAEVKEWQWRVFYTIYPNIVAWLLGYSVYNILGFMGY
jgi:ferrous iron transport protein B